jgi:serine/threonine protein kinase
MSSTWILNEILFISEVQFGRVLGKGVAGIVREVKSINLLDEPHCSYSALSTNLSKKCSDSVQNDAQAESENSKDRDTENLSYPYSSRNGLAALCKRNKESRYAVKSIMVEDACVEQQARARIDLAIEVSYLKVLSHRHIVKIRGSLNTSDLFHPKFFFVMDRLYGTLQDKIGEWDQSMNRKMMDRMHIVQIPFRRGKSFSRNRELLKERLFVAYDIASALSYMHHNKVIHR